MSRNILLLLLILGIYSSWLIWFNNTCWYANTYSYRESKLEKRYKNFESNFILYMYYWSRRSTYNYFLFCLTLVVGLLLILLFDFSIDVYDEWIYWHSSGQWDVFIYSMQVNPLGGLFVLLIFLLLVLFFVFFIFMVARLLFIIYLPEYFKR